ncbi:MAG: class I mannose-6-phosphate isomerase [Coprobacillaceae bacterium]
MKYLNRKSNYNKHPETKITGYDKDAYAGYKDIIKTIKTKLGSKQCIVIDCYPGVDEQEVLTTFEKELQPKNIINSEDIFYDSDTLNQLMDTHLTEDRVRGVMYYGDILDFIDKNKLKKYQDSIRNSNGLTLIYGFGASLITMGDVLVYVDMTRWEIQLRYRDGMPNFKQTNYDEDVLKKNKRGYFIEWRIADKHKQKLYDAIDFYLDTNTKNKPKMVTGKAFREGLKQLVKQPFRLVPYFDPGVWGGQWMKEVCDLPPEKENYAWSFDGVPEENSLYLRYGNIVLETPAMNLVKYQPKELLGEKNCARFGSEFPIRFDFLDTMQGQNLSLQVHPTVEYIKSKFGMPYTQNESYYILDAGTNGGVYLGMKDDADEKEMISDLKESQSGKSFNADKYINLFPANKHDHFLIPAGTIHCSTAECMVLEISATPYIFTFKLWDWDRVGLDGLPRPIHIEDGEKVIDYTRRTKWVKDNLVNCFSTIHKDCDYEEVQTGLHALEFIETRVITSKKSTIHKTNNGVTMLNLVDGSNAKIESPTNAFSPYIVHYAETFIIPADIEEYMITPVIENEEIKVLKAYVRY